MCDHGKVRQESGDRVCVVATCPDSATADLITSCCLVEPVKDDETGGTVCSQCATPTDRPDPLTPEEHAQVAKLLRQYAKALKELGGAMASSPRGYSSGETAENHETWTAKGRAKLTNAALAEALADKLSDTTPAETSLLHLLRAVAPERIREVPQKVAADLSSTIRGASEAGYYYDESKADLDDFAELLYGKGNLPLGVLAVLVITDEPVDAEQTAEGDEDSPQDLIRRAAGLED